MFTKKRVLALVAGTGLTVSGLGATPALAAQQPQPLDCAGHQITVRVNQNNSKENGGWNAAIITDGGSGVLDPTSFSGSAYDEALGQEIFSFAEVKGNGNANHTQDTVTCTDTTTMPLEYFLEPGDEVPPGASLDDPVDFSITVTAVVRP